MQTASKVFWWKSGWWTGKKKHSFSPVCGINYLCKCLNPNTKTPVMERWCINTSQILDLRLRRIKIREALRQDEETNVNNAANSQEI